MKNIIGHSGRFACPKCHHEGTWHGRKPFVYIPENPDPPPRTDSEFRARIGEGHFENNGRRSPLEGMFFLVFSSVSYQFQLIKTKITTRNKHNNLICSDVVGLNMIDDFLIDGINLIHRVTWRYLRYLTGDRDRMTRKRKRNPLFIPTTLVSSHLF